MELEEAIQIVKNLNKRTKECMKSISTQKDNFEEDEDYICFKEDSEAVDIVLKELESLQITNDLLYKTNKDLMKKQMQNIENIGTIELLGNEKWSIE